MPASSTTRHNLAQEQEDDAEQHGVAIEEVDAVLVHGQGLGMAAAEHGRQHGVIVLAERAAERLEADTAHVEHDVVAARDGRRGHDDDGWEWDRNNWIRGL